MNKPIFFLENNHRLVYKERISPPCKETGLFEELRRFSADRQIVNKENTYSYRIVIIFYL